jgi:uncharacterized protein YndB with AHSA1/START domain
MTAMADSRRSGSSVWKSKNEQASFSHSLVIGAAPQRILDAFFDPADLAAWWRPSRSVTIPRLFGAYALQWATSDYRDEVLGPLGGTFHGTVVEYTPGREFLVADAFWLPPEGEPIGPMALEVVCEAHESERALQPATLLRVAQKGYEESERWTRYYDVLRIGLRRALDTMKLHLEQNG